MPNQKVLKALNEQLNAELFSSYQYLAMAAFFESQNFKGFSQWMKMQSSEEYAHAMKFYDFIQDTNGNVELQKIDSPKLSWNSPLELFEEVLKHEKSISSKINNLYELSMNEKDYPTSVFLQWFITEQVEEESSATDIVERLKMIGDNKNGLFYLDRELGFRGKS